MSKTEKQVLGTMGEDRAILFLKEHGFSIIERNYAKKWGEIDVVAQKGNELHFVEVKTVSVKCHENRIDRYEPEDNVHSFKRARFARTIETYLLERNIPDDEEYVVDVISVYYEASSQRWDIHFIEDIKLS